MQTYYRSQCGIFNESCKVTNSATNIKAYCDRESVIRSVSGCWAYDYIWVHRILQAASIISLNVFTAVHILPELICRYYILFANSWLYLYHKIWSCRKCFIQAYFHSIRGQEISCYIISYIAVIHIRTIKPCSPFLPSSCIMSVSLDVLFLLHLFHGGLLSLVTSNITRMPTFHIPAPGPIFLSLI